LIFKEVGTHFIVVFSRETVEPDEKTAPANAPVNAPVSAPVNRLQERLLMLIKQNPKATLDSLAEQSGRDRSTVRRNIAKMKELGVLKRVGSDKSGHWEITDTTNK
jgi:predicted HTH transcriptional regulator